MRHNVDKYSRFCCSFGSDFEEEIKYRKSTSAASNRKKKGKQKIVSSDSDQSVEVVKSSVNEPGTKPSNKCQITTVS